VERSGLTLLLEHQMAGKNAEIRILRDEMWDIDYLTRIQSVPDPDVFLETLLCTVKGSVISYQTWVQKTETAKKSTLIKTLDSLKKNYTENFERINTLEIELNALIEQKVQKKVKAMKIFECLNAEKATPHFLNLAKSTQKNVKLENIRKPDGTEFADVKDREAYIVNY
jgi:hypothetical protein